MRKLAVLLLLFVFLQQKSFSQNTADILETIDYTKIILPTLETLFENAKKSPSVAMFESKMMEQDNLLKTEQRSWLKYFKVGGSWQYGNIGINSMFTDEYTPLFYQYSGATQNSFFVNGVVSVPLDDIFDRGNRVKRQKMQRRSTELEMEKWLDEQKMRIVTSYIKVNSALSTLKRKVEDYNIAEANYRMTENDFKLGNATISDLNNAKKMETEAFEIMKTNEFQITSEILMLEILSKTPIISR